MTKLKVTLILLGCVLSVSTQNATSEAQEKIDNILKPPPNSALQKQYPHGYNTPPEQPSFMSKIASWIFPFGGGNEKPAEPITSESQQRYAPQYSPTAQHGYPQQPCNPCNREPWIPVAGRHGKDTVIGFVEQSHVQNQGYLLPPPNSNQQPPGNFHGGPHHGSSGYSQHGQYPSAPLPPPPRQQYGVPRDNYGSPTNAKPTYNRPPDNFRTPLQHVMPPPLPKYTNPSFKAFGLPHQKLYPLKQGFPPSKQGTFKPGSSKYRINAPAQHGPPIPLNFGKPQLDKQRFSPPPPVSPPSSGHSVNIHVPTRENDEIILQPPSFDVNYIPPPLPYYDAILKDGISNNQQLLPVPLPNYDTSFSTSSANFEQNLLNGQRYNYPNFNSAQYAVGFDKPIPFPGMSLYQIPPLHNSQPFHQGFNSASVNNVQHNEQKAQASNQQNVHNVQVIPSIRVADFLASIEHPINVIQSPIVDVIAAENNEPVKNEPVDSYVSNNVQLSENPIIVDSHDEDNHAAATAQNLTYYNPTQNETSNYNIDVGTLPNFDVQTSDNNKESSLFETLRAELTDDQLKTLFQSQNPFEHFSTSNINITNDFIANQFSQILNKHSQNENGTSIYKEIENQLQFTQPPMDYSNWTPSFGTISTSILPPPLGEPVWNTAVGGQQIIPTTKKPKQVQIIIPYITKNPTPVSNDLYTNRGSKEHLYPVDTSEVSSSPTLPLYTQPPSVEPVWSHYVTHANSEAPIAVGISSTERSASISTIKDVLLKNELHTNYNKLPFDIIRLQKNIDDWTEKEFSTGFLNTQKASTSAKLVPSKKIPSEYLTTQPYRKPPIEVSTISNIQDILYDHEAAGSNTKISTVESNEDIDTNFILNELLTTTEALTTSSSIPVATDSQKSFTATGVTAKLVSTTHAASKNSSQEEADETVPVTTPNPMWEKLQVSISPLTKEKVYVVTPQPWRFTPKDINEKLLSVTEPSNGGTTSSKFSVVIRPDGHKHTKEITKDASGELQIVYSEWPHLINNLETTTTTEKPKSTHHPLLGLMDLSSYTPPPNSTVETYAGHSRVITVVTPASAPKQNEDVQKKTTITTSQ